MSTADDMKTWIEWVEARLEGANPDVTVPVDALTARLSAMEDAHDALVRAFMALDKRVAALEQGGGGSVLPWPEEWRMRTGQVPMLTNTGPAGIPVGGHPFPVLLTVDRGTPVIDGGRRCEVRPRDGDSNNIEREPWGLVDYRVRGQLEKAPGQGRAVLVQFHGSADPGDGKGANPVLALEMHYGRLRLVHTVQANAIQTGVDRTIYELPGVAPFEPFTLSVAANWQPQGQGAIMATVNGERILYKEGLIAHSNEKNVWWSVGPYDAGSDLTTEWRLRIDRVERVVHP